MLIILSLSDLKHFALQTKHTCRHTENVLCLDSLIDLTMMIIISVTRKYKFYVRYCLFAFQPPNYGKLLFTSIQYLFFNLYNNDCNTTGHCCLLHLLHCVC